MGLFEGSDWWCPVCGQGNPGFADKCSKCGTDIGQSWRIIVGFIMIEKPSREELLEMEGEMMECSQWGCKKQSKRKNKIVDEDGDNHFVCDDCYKEIIKDCPEMDI